MLAVPEASVEAASVANCIPPAVCTRVPDGMVMACGELNAADTGIVVANVTTPVAGIA